MELNFKMSAAERNRTNLQVDEVNKRIGRPTGQKNGMDKDAFLRLLVTQLSHQDPTNPMQDKEFVSQMAQFSSLEQMSNMNSEMKNLIQASQSSQAFSLLGKTVNAVDGAKDIITGEVTSVFFNEGQVMLQVNNSSVSLADVMAVHGGSAKQKEDLN